MQAQDALFKNRMSARNDLSRALYVTLADVIRNEYGVVPFTFLKTLSFSTVMDQIKVGRDNGKPIAARAEYSGWTSGHFITVCGFDSVSEGTCYVTVMDSLEGGNRIFPVYESGGQRSVYYYSVSNNTHYPITIYLLMS